MHCLLHEPSMLAQNHDHDRHRKFPEFLLAECSLKCLKCSYRHPPDETALPRCKTVGWKSLTANSFRVFITQFFHHYYSNQQPTKHVTQGLLKIAYEGKLWLVAVTNEWTHNLGFKGHQVDQNTHKGVSGLDNFALLPSPPEQQTFKSELDHRSTTSGSLGLNHV